MRLVFLPGLDGLGEMLGPVIQALDFAESQVLTYPPKEWLDYPALQSYVQERWPEEDFILIVDSFSGPIAIQQMATQTTCCRALVFVSTFARHPVPEILARVAYPFLTQIFRLPPPSFVLKTLVLGWSADPKVLTQMRTAIARVEPYVVARRLRAVATVDVCSHVGDIKIPTLYLRGRQDRIVGRGAGDLLKSLNSKIQIQELDAPHLILQTRPEEAAVLILDFLKREALL